LEHFRLAVSANPYYPHAIALANLGAHQFNKGEIARALEFYQQALAVNPDYALVHKHVATIYALPDYDRPDLAAFHLRRSLELDPEQDGAKELKELLTRAEEEMARRGAAGAADKADEPTADRSTEAPSGLPAARESDEPIGNDPGQVAPQPAEPGTGR
jgi:tetratricopeptide (TPR) repeat protein